MSSTPRLSCICFYNPCNFGDAFFASPFIRHICESNPSRTFYYFLGKGEYIFSGHPLPNLHNMITTILHGNSDIRKRVVCLLQNNIENKYADDTIQDTHYIFFNVWCHALSAGDLVFDDLCSGFSRSLTMINADYNETLVNTVIPVDKRLPIVQIPKSMYIHNGYREWIVKWRKSVGAGAGAGVDAGVDAGRRRRVLVFIFNFVLQSAVNHPYVMNNYIVGLARMFRNTHTFLVPTHAPEFDAFPNIICCHCRFDCSEAGEPSFRNVFILETIARESDIIISQYCGASWIWFNQNLLRYYDTHNKPIYITHPVRANDYASKMNAWIKSAGGGERNVVRFVALTDLPLALV
jgi:hypothetical protein